MNCRRLFAAATRRTGLACLGAAPPNKRLKRTRHERASLVGCVGESLKRSVGWLVCFANRRTLNEATPIIIIAEHRWHNCLVSRSWNVWRYVPLHDGNVYAFPVRRLRNDEDELGLPRIIVGSSPVSGLFVNNHSGRGSTLADYCVAAYRCLARCRCIFCSARLLSIAA